MREIRILPQVLQDVAEAVAWYDGQRYPGLGDRFLETFYASLLHIQQDEEIYRAAYHDFHKILIRPFPYSVYYRLHSDIWIVTLVIHAARKPSLVRAILRDRK